jgi:VanZ family protein
MTSLPIESLRKPHVAWLSVAVWIAVIFLFSHQAYSGAFTESYLHDANIPIRKLAHITEFGILFLLSRFAISQSRFSSGWGNTRLCVAAYVFTLANALFDEWHQSFVPGRSATLSDATVDMCGAMLAWIAVFLILKLKRHRP